MFGPGGFVYVYFSYGMHWCMNLVCGAEGDPSAVLLRAGEVVTGLELAQRRRTTARVPRDLARGPARLTSALGVDKAYDGADADGVRGSALRVLAGAGPRPTRRSVARGPRVGVAGDGAARPWRFWIEGEPTVSVYRPAVRVADVTLSTRAGGLGYRSLSDARNVAQYGSRTRTIVSETHILDELQWRGLVALSTDEAALREALSAGPVTFYCGFDPTAPSLHMGNLVQLLTMRRLQDAGHKPLALVGGSTGLIGDPKPTSERDLNDKEVVAAWVEKLREQVSRFLSAEGDNAVRVVNNLDWTAPLSAIDFLRDIGKHYRVNKMITKEAVAARLNSQEGISYTEFSYQMLQGLDFLELYRQYGCTLQTGGSDQWGNLTSGTDLIQHAEHASVHLIATPLVTKADGTKYGKTEGGDRLARRRADVAVRLLPVLAQRRGRRRSARCCGSSRSAPATEIEALERSARERPQLREAQRALASEVTTLVHGAEAARRVEEASQALFGRGELSALDADTLRDAAAELPSAVVKRVDGAPLPSVLELFTETGLAASRSAARRAVAEGGAYVNNVRVTDEGQVPGDGDLLAGRWLLLRRGKRSSPPSRSSRPAPVATPADLDRTS